MNISPKLIAGVLASCLLQLSIYIYFDQVLLAPASAFQVSASPGFNEVTSGKAYYSYDRRYMAIVQATDLKIYKMPGKQLIRTVKLDGQRQLSFFKWLEDRNLALMGLNYNEPSGSSRVILTQLNPVGDGHELATTIKGLPRDSKFADVVYSTATNVIYMQVQVSENPVLYRLYRTDANHDLKRIYLNTSRINRIGVLYDQDFLIFDDLIGNTVIARHGDGSWRIISPEVGKYRLVSVDKKNHINIARLNTNGLVQEVLTVDVKGKILYKKSLSTPLNISHVK